MSDFIIEHNTLDRVASHDNLNKLAILKLHGECSVLGPISTVDIKNGKNPLDLAVEQTAKLNASYSSDVPLLVMTSFNTHDDIILAMEQHKTAPVRTIIFQQSRYPCIDPSTMLPMPRNVDEEGDVWYAPGSGDLFASLVHNGLLDQLLAEGKEYLFVSDICNVGATFVLLFIFIFI